MNQLILQRSWMYNHQPSPVHGFRKIPEFVAGLEEFIHSAYRNGAVSMGKLLCPCKRCKNRKWHSPEIMKDHVLSKGFLDDYHNWTSHGEAIYDWDPLANISEEHGLAGCASQEGLQTGNEYAYYSHNVNTLNDFGAQSEQREYGTQFYSAPPTGGSQQHQPDYGYNETSSTAGLLHGQPLWPGNTSLHTDVSVNMRLMNIKNASNMSESVYDNLCSFFSDLLPPNNTFPRNFYETKKVVGRFQHPFEKIDVCVRSCMLYYKEDEKLEVCKFCEEPRYKLTSSSRGGSVARKSMYFLPLTPRLSRLFQCPETATEMTWHKFASRNDPDVMTHPSDAKSWKNFDSKYPHFAQEPRNVRLGLCSDGFSPFSTHGSGRQYSCWPVIMTPYNLPPSLCMKERFLFLTCMIPGPKSPGKKIDVYLQPLIDELKILWETGVPIFDVSKQETFQMRAALMWTVNDFPAYAMLSGWQTQGKLACPVCMHQNIASYLPNGRKVTWFDCHRKFLDANHPYRWNKTSFRRNTVEYGQSPVRISGEKILNEEIRCYPKITVAPSMGKLPAYNDHPHNWTKKSIFWDLPYWQHNDLRHNLDVMHIEKNVFESLFNTIMKVSKMTKDNLEARKDIATMCYRKSLEPIYVGDNKFVIPKAKYVLEEAQAKEVCRWVKQLKFDGFVSNLDHCVDEDNHKLMNMKSHDCHVFMERLMPIAFHCFLPIQIWKTVSELSTFFREICASGLRVTRLTQLNRNIVLTMCKLETQFPPSLFDSMEHLVIHLAEEALLGGPVQYRWMYPFERYMHVLKKKCTNRRHVEASIVHAYIREEAAYFSQLFESTSIASSSDKTLQPTSIFNYPGVGSGWSRTFKLSEKERNAAEYFILRNIPEVQPLIKWNADYYKGTYGDNLTNHELEKLMTDNVPAWFRHWIQEQGSNISHWWLKVAVQGPRLKARRFQKYAVNGYKFRVADSGTTKLKEGSGVSVLGEDDDGNETAWYGNLIDIIELIYSKEPLLTIVLFKCRWFALNRMVNFIEHGLTLVDKKRMCDPDYEPYILAQNALLVYYTSIPGSSNVPRRKDMLAVCKVKPTSQIDSNEIEAAFQEEPPAPAQNIPLVELETEDIELGDPNTSEMVLNDPEDNNDRDPQDNESDDVNDEDEDQIMLELEDEDSDEE